MSKLLTMPKAAAQLGLERSHAAQWLRRYLLRRELDTGRTILLKRGRRYYVSMSNLRRYAPELVDPADEIQRGFRELLRDRKRQDQRLHERLDDLTAEVSLLTEQVRKIMKEVGA